MAKSDSWYTAAIYGLWVLIIERKDKEDGNPGFHTEPWERGDFPP